MTSEYEKGKIAAFKEAQGDLEYDNIKNGIPEPPTDPAEEGEIADKVDEEIKQHVEEKYGQD